MSTAEAPPFSLSHLASQLASENDSADYRDWVDDFLDGIPTEHYAEAVREMALNFLRLRGKTAIRPAKVIARASGEHGGSRWHNASTVYKSILASIIGIEGEAVRLGDATREQVLEAAKVRREMAAANARSAAAYERLAEAMRRRKAKTVAELPEDLVLEAFREQR